MHKLQLIKKKMETVLRVAWFACMLTSGVMSSCPNNFQANPEKGPLGIECELTSSAAPTGDASLCYAKIDLHSYREQDKLPDTVISTIRAKFEALRRVGTQPLIRHAKYLYLRARQHPRTCNSTHISVQNMLGICLHICVLFRRDTRPGHMPTTPLAMIHSSL